MARLLTTGGETGSLTSEGLVVGAGSPAASTSAVRTGTYGLRAATTSDRMDFTFTGATLRNYYAKVMFRKSANPTSGGGSSAYVIELTTSGGTDIAYVLLNTAGQLELWTPGGQIGAASSSLNNNQWYRVEMRARVNGSGSGTTELLIDGSSIVSSTTANLGTTAPGQLSFGPNNAAGLSSVGNHDYDDIAFNDETAGGVQTSYPGAGNVVMLLPIRDSALGNGWEAPQTTGSDTTNIYDAVDNRPPAGVAHSDADANNLKYIFNAANDATTNYDAVCQAYTDLGLTSASSVSLVQAVINTGGSSATDTAGAVQITSNPAEGSETSFAAFDNGIAGTFPTNWRATKGPVNYAPTVALGSGPILRVGKRTGTTRVAMVDFMGVQVEYTDGTRKSLPPPMRVTRLPNLRR